MKNISQRPFESQAGGPVSIIPSYRQEEISFFSFPLSFAQQRLWFLEHWEPGNPLYLIPNALRLTGRLDVSALGESLLALVQRHESLRTTFAMRDGEPMQYIIPGEALSWEIPLVSLEDLPAQQQEVSLMELITREAFGPFDVSRPLVRAALVRLNAEEHVLLLTLHHLIADGWSLNILFQELLKLYNATVQYLPSPLPELPLQYVDFAVWQRDYLQGRVLEELLHYWQQQLQDLPESLPLPFDRPRWASQTAQGTIYSFFLPASLTSALQRLSQREGVSLSMTLLAGFKALLYRYTGQTDLAIGTTVANRNRAETQGLIGFFVNTVVLRTHLTGNLRFRELLHKLRDVALDAYTHEDLPFEKLVEVLHPEREISRTPLVPILFAVQNAPVELPGVFDLTVKPIEIEARIGTTNFDMALDLAETPQGMKGMLEYNTDLFNIDTISRLTQHYITLLEGVAQDPEQPLWKLPLITEQERRQILFEWNSPPQALHQEETILSLFTAQAAQTPETVALVVSDHQVTYHELDQLANCLAHYLQRLHIGPDVLVGICMERSPELVICLLAILKAGGGYVPLDPAYPQERSTFILTDARVSLLLTQRHLKEPLAAAGIATICLEEIWNYLAQEDQRAPTRTAVGENIAYVIYTSGSTGTPKGVLIPHHALLHHNQAFARKAAIQARDRVLQFASICFDVAAEELYPTLLNGATVVLRSEEMTASLANFSRFLSQEALTVLNLPASYWHEWVRDLAESRELPPASIRLMIVGAERVAPEYLAMWQQMTEGGIRWWNVYGPTETTITATMYEATSNSGTHSHLGSVPIGYPLGNTRAYVLDAHLQLVPPGIASELYIGGDGLARGYLNQADLTAEKFIPDSFSPEPGSRLYKTGDLVRYLPGGNLDFIGRVDQQVKVRGFRVEPGEIEAAIRQHPAIHDCVVIAHERSSGQNRLLAYIVALPGSEISSNSLRSFLRERLPDYMLPAAFIKLSTIPRTVNHKVDYLALPSPDLPSPESLPDIPRTPTEEALAEIWADVLEMERVGIHENFFELGGHSLQAIRIVSRVNHTLLHDLSLRVLFERPTIASLASTIDAHRKANAGLTGLEVPPPLPVPRENYLPLSFSQQRFWFLSQWAQERYLYNMPAVLRLSGRLNQLALAQSLHELMRRHEILRTTFTVVDGQPVQLIAPPPATAVAMPVVDFQALSIQEREREIWRLINEEAWRPFDLSRGPLLRATLLYISATEAWLLLTQHHIISDDWSLNIIVQELMECYRAFSMGDIPQLPQLSLHYADFACWQRTWLQGKALEKQLMYWRKQLDGVPHALELPTDHPRPPLQTFQGLVRSITLPASLVRGLKELSRKEGATLFMTLLTAFNTLLHRYSGQDDIVVGTPIANRTRIEFERIPGLFLNTLVLRSNLSGDPQFQELLRRTREVVLEAYTHQDLPFEKLVEELQSERDLSRNALFQVLFILQPAPASPPTLPQLTIEFVDIESNTAKLDLTLTVKEEHGSMIAAMEYNSALFDGATITRMLGHFRTLLNRIVAQPEQHLSALPLLTEEELHQILYAWNATQTAFPGEQCLHQLFEIQARRTPDAIALICSGEHVTYAWLNHCANRLAIQLRDLGVDAEVLVALLLERSIDFIISILAIFKAGGAFLPLDMQHPSQRHAQIVQQSGCAVVLTREKYSAGLMEVLRERSSSQAVQVISIGSYVQLDATEQAEKNLPVYNTPKNLAYVMYTSGSTGNPKGVMVEQVGMINHMCAKIKDQGINAWDNVAQNGPPCFDIVVWQCLAALTVGGRVTIFQDEITYHPGRFLEHIVHENVTVLQVVPSLLRILLQQAMTLGEQRPVLDHLRWIVPTGDALPPELCRQWLQLYPTIPLLNTYGSTECSDDQCHSAISIAPSPPYDTPIMPIGQPIQNMCAYVLDQHLLPVPIGVVGDLYVAGVGVGRGYLQDPARTAEVFLPDSFAQEAGARMYKTRDRARYLSDGQLEFIGRSDHLVKIHGMRIEPGEIEVTLERHNAVQEAVVNVRQTKKGDKYLAAYVIARHHSEALGNELREWLRERLPEYMVPAAIVFLDSMPLNSNGKVDRRMLPDPEYQQEEHQVMYMPPTTRVEQVITSVWQEVLGIEKVGLRDNFFALGGHSLLLAQVQSKLQEILRREMTIVDLFRYPTVETLATYMELPGNGEQEAALRNIQERVKKQKEALKRRKRST